MHFEKCQFSRNTTYSCTREEEEEDCEDKVEEAVQEAADEEEEEANIEQKHFNWTVISYDENGIKFDLNFDQPR